MRQRNIHDDPKMPICPLVSKTFTVANRYWLNGQGIEARWRWHFPLTSGPDLVPTQLLTPVPGHFWR